MFQNIFATVPIHIPPLPKLNKPVVLGFKDHAQQKLVAYKEIDSILFHDKNKKN